MAKSVKEFMIKRKSPTEKPEVAEEEKKKRSKWIRIAIIFATFAAIVILSIVSQGDSDGPSWNVIVTRIVLLSVSTVLYFFMLFRSVSGGKKTEERPKAKKK